MRRNVLITSKKMFQSEMESLVALSHDYFDHRDPMKALYRQTILEVELIDRIRLIPQTVLRERLFGVGFWEWIVLYGHPQLFRILVSLHQQLKITVPLPVATRSLRYWSLYNPCLEMFHEVMSLHESMLSSLDDGTTLAHTASYLGDLTVLSLLERAAWYVPDRQGHLPIWYAILNGHTHIESYFEGIHQHASASEKKRYDTTYDRAKSLKAWRLAAVSDAEWSGVDNMSMNILLYQHAIQFLEKIEQKNDMDFGLLMHCYGRAGVLNIQVNCFLDINHLFTKFKEAHIQLLRCRMLMPSEAFLYQECHERIQTWLVERRASTLMRDVHRWASHSLCTFDPLEDEHIPQP